MIMGESERLSGSYIPWTKSKDRGKVYHIVSHGTIVGKNHGRSLEPERLELRSGESIGEIMRQKGRKESPSRGNSMRECLEARSEYESGSV